jgi:AcrR family transcriptional regulator
MTVAERKQREKERRKTEILDSAERLFIENGYDGTSVDDIAKTTELSKGTIFLYFGSKDALFMSVVLRGIRKLNGMIVDAVAKQKTELGKLRSIGEAVLRYSTEYPDNLSLMKQFRSGRFEIGAHPTDDAKEIMRLSAENDRLVVDTIRSGIEKGEIRSDVDPVELALLLRFVTGGIMNMESAGWDQLEQRGLGREKLVEDLWLLVKRSISKEGSN